MTPTRLKRHRKRRHTTEGHLALVPFIDMLTILVVFMLLHTADVDILPNTKNISIPQSASDIKPRETVVVTITRDRLFVDGRPVVTVADIATSTGNVIAPLKAALLDQHDRVLGLAINDDAVRREVTIMGDKSTPYNVLKKVMATCTGADYARVSLAVFERERVAGNPVGRKKTV